MMDAAKRMSGSFKRKDSSTRLSYEAIDARPTELEVLSDERQYRGAETSVFKVETRTIRTTWGNLKVAMHGDESAPTVLTYHDAGTNFETCFQSFFNFMGLRSVWSLLRVIHINAPFQEAGASPIGSNAMPTFQQLVDQVGELCDYFRVRSVFGLGVGAGANVLVRFAVNHPDRVRGLILVGPSPRGAGWLDWIGSKMDNLLSGGGEKLKNALLQRWFCDKTIECNPDLCHFFRDVVTKGQPTNAVRFLQLDAGRPALNAAQLKLIRSKLFLIVGKNHRHFNKETVELYGGLDPRNQSVLLELPECGLLITEEHPEKLAEPVTLFFKGFGIFAPTSAPAMPLPVAAGPSASPTAAPPARPSRDDDGGGALAGSAAAASRAAGSASLDEVDLLM